MMQTIETMAIAPEAVVSPCPFCGAEPYWLGVVTRGPSGRVEPHFYHPGVANDKDCVLSGRGFSLDEVAAWNARASLSSIPAQQEPVAWRYELAQSKHPTTGAWGMWGQPRLGFDRPMVPDDAVRNLTPLFTSAQQEEVTEAMQDEIVAAYKQGALDVHEAWIEGCGEENAPSRDPDFTEAAHDYAAMRSAALRGETK